MKIIEATFVTSASSRAGYPNEVLPEIAFAGRSNVGKSSLINCLVGRRKLASTSSTPGKTRLLNFFSVNRKLGFVDLPGYGYAKVPEQIKESWRPMVEEYLESRGTLKGVVVVVDVRRDLDRREYDLIGFLRRGSMPLIVAATKADKLSKRELLEKQRLLRGDLREAGINQLVMFSSVSGMGRKELWAEIIEAVGSSTDS